MSVKYFLSFFIFVVSFLFIVTDVNAATGRDGATGGIFFVEGNNGVVGWAQNYDGGVINVDLYITKRGVSPTNFVCSAGNVPANKTLPNAFEAYDRIKSKNSRLFTFANNCIQDLADGDYDVYLALGPNLFSDTFQFSVITDTITNTRLWAHYLGVLINRVSNNYDSYPTVMKDGSVYKMWYASGNTSGHDGDNIFYAESANGIDWDLIQGPLEGGAVLTPTFNNCTCSQNGSDTPYCPSGQDFAIDDMHVADPSVVKVNNTYYMYYTVASKKYSCFGSNNHISMATSTDGIKWIKNSAPVIYPQNPCISHVNCGPWVDGYSFWYGAGMPSVIYYDYDRDGVKEFVNFYADTSLPAYSMTLAIAKNANGNNFNIFQKDIVGENTYDFKYNAYIKKYMMLNAIPTSKDTPGLILIAFGNNNQVNKLEWDFITAMPDQGNRKVAFKMDSFTENHYNWVVHNAALLSNSEGIINGRGTVMYMGSGLGMQNEA